MDQRLKGFAPRKESFIAAVELLLLRRSSLEKT
jgi:hypothetical protein